MVSTSGEVDEILQKYYDDVLCEINGTTMTIRHSEIKQKIDEWEVNEEDVWICSFPKTGTTWTQEMVWMIMHGLDFKGGEVDLKFRSPFFEFASYFNLKKFISDNSKEEHITQVTDSLEIVKNMKGPLCVKTHLPWILLPQQIQNGTKKPKIVYVTRNAKDTCNSLYHFSKMIYNYSGNYNDFCTLFLAGKVKYAPFWDHVLSYWQVRHLPNVLFIKYEEMKKDLPAVIRRVAKFLEKPLTEEQINILEKHLSFESMKANNSVNYEEGMEILRTAQNAPPEVEEAHFMRSGTVGSYKKDMDKEIVDRFDEWEGRNLAGTDYK